MLLSSVVGQATVHDIDPHNPSIRLEQKDTINPEEAKLMALDLLERFVTLSKLMGPDGEDYTKEFLSLFSMNASIPIDFFEGNRSDYGSPETYVSEYVASGIAQPLATTSKILLNNLKVEEVQGSNDYSVTMFLERIKTRTVVDSHYVQLEKPIKEIWKVIVTAYSYGGAQIYQLTRLAIPTITPLAFDLDFEFNLAKAQISAGSNVRSIIGLDQMDVNSNNISFGLNYRFLPFRDLTSEEPIKYYMKAAIGLDFTSYTTEALNLSGQLPDYLSDDGVYLLINAPDSLNDSPLAEGSGDFILFIEDEFEKEKLNVTTLDLMIGGGYQFNDKLALELGLGMVTSASGEIAVKSDHTRYATFSEGYFQENPVTIYPGSATFALQSETLNFDDQGEAYGLRNNGEDLKYKAETNSAMYLELKLIQMFDVGDFALGGTVSIRTLLGSPLSRDLEGTNALRDVGLDGVPRLIAFTEKFNPFYIGFGIRIQKR
jgi:hypothetical protein